MWHVEKAGFRFDQAAVAQLGMARIFNLRRQTDSALYYARLSLATSHRMKLLAGQADAAALLHELYAPQSPKDSAYKYLSLFKTLNDSLNNQEKIKQTENIKYKEALRLQKLEQEQEAAQFRYKTQIKTYTLAGGLLLLLLFAFVLYRLKRIRHETRLKSTYTKRIHQIEMRALRAQMNPHFIFNCLNSINRYIVKSDHKTASGYLTKFAKLIRLILDNSTADTITLDKEIQTLQLYLDMEILRFDNVFAYAIELDEALLPETITIPSMLLQPYVENAIWHGLLHKETGAGKLWIRFQQPSGNMLIAEVEDNGIGRQKAKELKSKEAIQKKSYGMQISEDRIFLINELYDIKARVRVEDLVGEENVPRGTKVIIELPVKNL
jgi:sensor histidine kinase YesM